ncbi:MAG TPA: XdhC family protein [Micromonosporaceae bacterium]
MSSLDGWDVLEHAQELARRGEPFALATVVWRAGPSSGQQSARALITESGQLYGWIGGACAEPVVVREAQRVIAEGKPKLLALGAPDQFGTGLPEGMVAIAIACQSEGALQVYIEPVSPSPQVVIVGRSPMAHTLADLVTALGWRARLHDSGEFSAADVNARSIVIVATQGHGDEEALEQAVMGGRSVGGAADTAFPVFVGLVASRKRGEAVLGALADRGVPRNLLERVRVPVGLDLGHTTHREIAVAILAELVRLRAAGELTGRPADAGDRAALPVLAVTEARDPVCGMTVPADSSSRPYEFEGVTYYFCCPGCRRSFVRDPHAYLSAESGDAQPVRSSLVRRYDAPFPSQEEA